MLLAKKKKKKQLNASFDVGASREFNLVLYYERRI